MSSCSENTCGRPEQTGYRDILLRYRYSLAKYAVVSSFLICSQRACMNERTNGESTPAGVSYVDQEGIR